MTRAEYIRDYQAARMRALTRLKDRHRGEYAALLAEERGITQTTDTTRREETAA